MLLSIKGFSHCQPTCNEGYTLSGSQSCYLGTLTDTAECQADPCVASDDPAKDGSDGIFYCINGGTVGGTTTACTCDCNPGYEDASCQTASACTASSDPAKDGSDGIFYCINGGTVGGTTTACTCTDCNPGYEDASCQTASACTASSDPAKDGSDGIFYCINGGTVGGTTTACTCDCNPGYEDASCQTASACTASSDPAKDGSDGIFYCINGGTVGGTTTACTCTSCATRYGGKNCHIGPCDMEKSCFDFNLRNGMTTPASCAFLGDEDVTECKS
ncbi:predicted protein [Micromonas commoda]|uniref:EGF-like domain-containing protein n=1 Tax=Micromonas commoda (strain RCC299 / NOUM17 / CCMP2709) TaxID=296587 RepID=C1FIB7_MICCC|nr:predicted protein [Micromonas commoda]ACO69967.1 predicted protein [Micromonas commoda]|eukprot:XP_002508709.1 predicted protein [Micromonas commoda]